jgi:hypothetical protein
VVPLGNRSRYARSTSAYRPGRLEVRLADVVDDVVLLLRDHPGLGRHLAEAVGDRPIHGVGVVAVLECRGCEAWGGGQRAGLVPGPVAVGADAAIDRLAALEVLRSQSGDHRGVIEPAFVIGQGGRHQRRVGPQRAGPRRAILGDLHEVSREVEELLPGAQRIDQPGRHDRRPPPALLLDPPPDDRDRLAILTRVANDDCVRPILSQQTGDGPSIVGGDRDRLVSLPDRLRRLQDPLDQLDVGHLLTQCGQVRPEGWGRVRSFVYVTPSAREGRLIEDQGAAPGVAQASGVARQPRGIFPAELLVERPRHSGRGTAIPAGDHHHSLQDRRHEGANHVDGLRSLVWMIRCNSDRRVRSMGYLTTLPRLLVDVLTAQGQHPYSESR